MKGVKKVYHKGKHMYREVAKRSAAIMFCIIAIVGILLPAGVGIALNKMSDIGVDTLVASSSDTNSSIVVYSGVSWRRFHDVDVSAVEQDGRVYLMCPDRSDFNFDYDFIG